MEPGPSGQKKRRKRGKNAPEKGSLSEATRIRVTEIIEKFLRSDDEEYKLEEKLSNKERAAVHNLCRKMGIKSQSKGHGEDRHIYFHHKKKKADTPKGISFRFSAGSSAVLRDLFSQFPPNYGDTTVGKFKVSSGKGSFVVQRDDFFCRPTMDQSEIAKKVQSLVSRYENDPNLRQIAENRSKLPIASFRDVITSSVRSQQVVLICGETGCGKTTQVPQYLLDDAWSNGETCKIICTQPRRISATSVSERIASERGESIGQSVGYKIRMEGRGGRNSSLVFCTNGVLLRVLVNKRSSKSIEKASNDVQSAVSEITHIIVDEIHERDRFSDFMLAIIRDMLPLYPHLRLVLMSATIDAERFSNYFGGCPVIRVPGFTHPVKTFYLEDVLSLVRSTENNHRTDTEKNETVNDTPLTEECRLAIDEAIDLALSNDELDPLIELLSSQADPQTFNHQHSKTGLTPLMVFAGKGKVSHVCMLLSVGAKCDLRCNAGKTALNYAEQQDQVEAAEIIKKHMEKADADIVQELLDKYLSKGDPELIDCVLIEQLLRRICSDSSDGAVLVFLPGWDDINRTRAKLETSPFFKDPSKFIIISLHSMVPLAEQRKVFQRPPPGCRKIVLSTNIAETSVTIDDVVYVIDSGRMKEKSYDPYNNVSTLHSSWVSKASARQREGRAGRCQPGICYHLYSKLRASSMLDFQVPEIKRMPIEELCLQVKLIDPSWKIEEFLQKTLDPPVFETIRNAIIVLQDMGALSESEQLTELGEKLGALPVHPRTSKMLFLAILLNCLDPALTLACAVGNKDPFILPIIPTEKKKAQAARVELASLFGGNGDQLALIAAFECWRKAKLRGEVTQFCSQYYVSSSAMKMLARMRKQLETELVRQGFIPVNSSRYSLNAYNTGILHAVVFAGLYPMVGRIVPHTGKCLVETPNGDTVRVQQFSMNGKITLKKNEVPPLIMFDEVTRGDGGLHIRNSCLVGSLPLLLLATEIVVTPIYEDGDEEDGGSSVENDDNDGDEMETDGLSNSQLKKILSSPEIAATVYGDRWLPFHSTAIDVAQIYCLRERLSAAILFKVTYPREVLPQDLGASMQAIACILSYDGMSGIYSRPEKVDKATGNGQTNRGKGTPISCPSESYLMSLLHHGKQPNLTSPNPSHASKRMPVRKGNFSKRPRGNDNGPR